MTERSRTRRRHRRWWKRKTPRRLLLLTALVVGMALAWTMWSGVTVYRELTAARSAASDLQAAVDADDMDAAQAALSRLQGASAQVVDTTDGVTWRFVQKFPVVGQAAGGIGGVGDALLRISDSSRLALGVLRGREQLLADGTVDLDVLERLGEDATEVAEGFEGLVREGGALADSGLPGISAQGSSIRDTASPLADLASQAALKLTALPDALGAGSPRRYMLLFQNNAEIRSTGGLPGSAAVISADEGAIELERTFSPIVRTDEVGAVFSFTDTERALYGDDLDIGAVFLNSMPDSRRVADLVRQGWDQWYPAKQLDGVLTLDTVSLAYLLRATGPVAVDGRELSETNVVEELLFRAYERLDSNEEQDDFFGAVAEGVFDAATSIDDAGALVEAVSRVAAERRTSVHLTDSPELELGSFDDDAVVIGINNVSGDKMSYFLDYDASPVGSGCSPGVALSLSSTAPADPSGLPARLLERNGQDPTMTGAWHPVPLGSMLLRVVVRLPEGWGFRSDGLPLGEIIAGEEHTYWTGLVELAPGDRAALTLPMDARGASYESVPLQVTAPIQPRQASGTFPTDCR